MGMLLHRHWLEQQEALAKAEAEAKAKEQNAEEPPKNEEAAPETPKRRGRPKKGE